MEQQFCRNCGAEVSDEYCARCGQREGRADRRFLDLAGEMLGDIFDLDSRFWRTLFFLLLRPGYLSAEFMVGRRARYLPPLRLYLVISFAMFLVMSFDTSRAVSVTTGADPGEREKLVVVVNSESVDAAPEGEGTSDPDDWNAEIDLANENSPDWIVEIDRRAEQNIEKLREDPSEFIEAMVDHLPQLMFLLLPLFALLVQVAYLFSPFHYLQHLVFTLHYHSFVFLLYLVGWVLVLAGLDITTWLLLALVFYLPLALRRTYDSSVSAAVGKSLFIYFSYAWLLVGAFSAAAVVTLVLL